jgi:hypothetical protein
MGDLSPRAERRAAGPQGHDRGQKGSRGCPSRTPDAAVTGVQAAGVPRVPEGRHGRRHAGEPDGPRRTGRGRGADADAGLRGAVRADRVGAGAGGERDDADGRRGRHRRRRAGTTAKAGRGNTSSRASRCPNPHRPCRSSGSTACWPASPPPRPTTRPSRGGSSSVKSPRCAAESTPTIDSQPKTSAAGVFPAAVPQCCHQSGSPILALGDCALELDGQQPATCRDTLIVFVHRSRNPMKKKKVSLDIFEESVLPALQEKHADTAQLQKAIKEGYDIYEEGEDGKQTPVPEGLKLYKPHQELHRLERGEEVQGVPSSAPSSSAACSARRSTPTGARKGHQAPPRPSPTTPRPSSSARPTARAPTRRRRARPRADRERHHRPARDVRQVPRQRPDAPDGARHPARPPPHVRAHGLLHQREHAITESNKTWDNVDLTAKKLAALARSTARESWRTRSSRSPTTWRRRSSTPSA